MKLLLCVQCYDIVKLSTKTLRKCECGSVSGRYIDYVNAEVTGDPIVIGFNNSSLERAVADQLYRGDLTETMDYAGGKVIKGRSFEAFIIPESADSVKRLDEDINNEP